MMMRCAPAQPTMAKDWTGTSESESAPQSSDVDAEASIAQLNARLTILNSGSKDKEASLNDLQVKLAAAAATEVTSMVKWDAERQLLWD